MELNSSFLGWAEAVSGGRHSVIVFSCTVDDDEARRLLSTSFSLSLLLPLIWIKDLMVLTADVNTGGCVFFFFDRGTAPQWEELEIFLPLIHNIGWE